MRMNNTPIETIELEGSSECGDREVLFTVIVEWALYPRRAATQRDPAEGGPELFSEPRAIIDDEDVHRYLDWLGEDDTLIEAYGCDIEISRYHDSMDREACDPTIEVHTTLVNEDVLWDACRNQLEE